MKTQLLYKNHETIIQKQSNTRKQTSAANRILQKKVNARQHFQFVDNRQTSVVQRKLHNAMYTHQRKASQGIDTQNDIVQRVLRNPADAPREAQLIQRYHAREERGDAARDHAQAIGHYRVAIQARRQVNAMHEEADQGHLDAIGVLQGKIGDRNRAIAAAARPSAGARARARRRARAAAAAAPAPAAPANVSLGTASKASFLDGNPSAWHK